MALTPNMNLDLPTPNETLGPNWADLINDALELVDQHDHTSGKGVPITPAGLDISSDLDINSNNLDAVRGVRIDNQGAPITASGSDIRMIYASGGELYYNDAAGNQVRITLNGSVDVSATGAISGLTAPASADYSAGTDTFIWSHDTNQRANMSFGRAILADPNTASSKTITLRTPDDASLPSSYTMILPTGLPATSDRVMELASTGQVALSTANQVVNKVTRDVDTTVGLNGVAISAGSGVFSTSSLTAVNVTNLSATITTSGRPVRVCLMSDGVAAGLFIVIVSSTAVGNASIITIQRDSVGIYTTNITLEKGGSSEGFTRTMAVPSSAVDFIDNVGAGTYTYNVQLQTFSSAAGSQSALRNTRLVVYEL